MLIGFNFVLVIVYVIVIDIPKNGFRVRVRLGLRLGKSDLTSGNLAKLLPTWLIDSSNTYILCDTLQGQF